MTIGCVGTGPRLELGRWEVEKVRNGRQTQARVMGRAMTREHTTGSGWEDSTRATLLQTPQDREGGGDARPSLSACNFLESSETDGIAGALNPNKKQQRTHNLSEWKTPRSSQGGTMDRERGETGGAMARGRRRERKQVECR